MGKIMFNFTVFDNRSPGEGIQWLLSSLQLAKHDVCLGPGGDLQEHS